MASIKEINTFIESIAPIIQAQASARGYKFPSAIIAQACVESAYGTSQLSAKYHNYFGLKCGSFWKGRAVDLKTKEEYKKGQITTITALFRIYDSMEAGVEGYFDFINYSRYSNLKSATSSYNYLELIKKDGYATSSTYINTVYSLVKKYNLTKYDTADSSVKYYKKYDGKSARIDEVFEAIKVPPKYIGAWYNRKPVAIRNGIYSYTGTAKQNLELVDLAKKGKLKQV